jgi:nuclear GTP-binding protein
MGDLKPSAIESDDRRDHVRQRKRRRKDKDIPDYHAPIEENVLAHMERSNPLSRKNLKKELKRARKAHRAKLLAERSVGGGEEMDIDHDQLQFTFMA